MLHTCQCKRTQSLSLCLFLSLFMLVCLKLILHILWSNIVSHYNHYISLFSLFGALLFASVVVFVGFR